VLQAPGELRHLPHGGEQLFGGGIRPEGALESVVLAAGGDAAAPLLSSMPSTVDREQGTTVPIGSHSSASSPKSTARMSSTSANGSARTRSWRSATRISV